MSKKVLIVGTGLGGLSTGLRLAARGYEVAFVEKATQPGGRLNRFENFDDAAFAGKLQRGFGQEMVFCKIDQRAPISGDGI